MDEVKNKLVSDVAELKQQVAELQAKVGILAAPPAPEPAKPSIWKSQKKK